MQHHFSMLVSSTSLYLLLCCNFVTSRNIDVDSRNAARELSNVTAEEHQENKKAVFDQILETNERAHLLNDLYEGDIKRSVFRNAYGNKWPKNSNGYVTIPYTISQDYSSINRDLIQSAIDAFDNHTCVRFVPRKYQKKYVSIVNDSGCWSYVGRISVNKQELSLAIPGCMSRGSIMHELMHVIGFEHEQSRSDRDDYIRVINENFNQTRLRNFVKYPTQNLVVYDYTSIMHYTPHVFGKEPYLPTLKAHPQGYPSPDFGFNKQLSAYDIEEIKYLYDCGSETYTRCGRDFFHQDSGEFESPDYPYYDSEGHCTWNITVRPSKHGKSYVKLRFLSLDLENSNFCQLDSIIVHDGINAGAPILIRICGNSSELEFTSTGNHMFVIFTTDSSIAGRGFRASFERVLRNSPPSLTPARTNLVTAFRCNFDKDFCGMTRDHLADIEFILNSGSTPSDGTGPLSDRTPGPNHTKGNYIYLEASNVKEGSNAIVRTPWFNEGGYCIKFYYYMYGRNIGGFRVYALENNLLTADKDARMLWEIFDDRGPGWKTSRVIYYEALQKVQFYWEGFVDGYLSDIALDDIQITEGRCK